MATKKELNAGLVLAVTALCTEHGTAADFNEALLTIINDATAPKASGASGNVVEIMCSVSGAWLPATEEYFYAEKAEGKGIVGQDGSTGLKRLSRQAESVRKSAIKVLNATEKGIMADVLGGEMSPEDGQAALIAAKAVKPDYSTVGLIEAE